MSDAGVNAYQTLSEILKSEDGNDRDKIAGLMWARLANLLKSRGVIDLGQVELLTMFEKVIINPSAVGELKGLETAAEENDDVALGDFWAVCVYVSGLITRHEAEYSGYVADRFVSFFEKFYTFDESEIESEVAFIVSAVRDLRSRRGGEGEGLTDYVRQALAVHP